MNSAVVIGGEGVVGKATRHALGIKEYIDIESSTVGYSEIPFFRYIFICVPTPTNDGVCDVSIVDEVVGKCVKSLAESTGENFQQPIFIVRSTVIPGTCNKLRNKYGINIAHVPEFLTEKTWKKDAEWPDIVVIGSSQKWVRKEVSGIYKSRYSGAEFIETGIKTAETVKYAINNLYIMKVVYANQLYDYCQKEDINYTTVKKAMYARKWIGKNHLDAWHKGKRGAGGKCLPKDNEAFANETNSSLLNIVNKLNKQYLKMEEE